MMNIANKAHLHEDDWHRTVFIDTKGVGATEFNLPREKINALIEGGEQGMRDYLKWFQDPKSKPINRL
jgi:NTE family protein